MPSHRRLHLSIALVLTLACVNPQAALSQDGPNPPGSFDTAKNKALKLYQDAGRSVDMHPTRRVLPGVRELAGLRGLVHQ